MTNDTPSPSTHLEGHEEEIARMKQRIADLTTERDNLSSIIASGIDEVAGAALDDAEETIQRLAFKGEGVTKSMIEAGARAVASRWGRTTMWEEDEAVAQSVLTAALNPAPQSREVG